MMVWKTTHDLGQRGAFMRQILHLVFICISLDKLNKRLHEDAMSPIKQQIG
jgi:hypothetical protein